GCAAPPHPHDRVAAPAVLAELEGPQHLQRLDALLAQARGVEHCGAAREVPVGEEGLHRPRLSRPRARLARAADLGWDADVAPEFVLTERHRHAHAYRD